MSKVLSKSLAKHIPAEKCHLYGICSIHALAKRLGWDLAKLESMAEDGGYRVYPHPVTGRIIQQPSDSLQILHKQFHKYLSRIQVPDYLHSAVKGRSYISNAKSHVNDGGLIRIDIKKFFPSVSQRKVMQFFRDDLNCTSDVAGLLANLICFNKKLATGSSVSPIISYYAFKSMFDEIADLADKYKLTMTCYVDDVVLSGEKASEAILHEIRIIIHKCGLKAHKEKYFRPGIPRIVTGLAVTDKDVRLPYARWRKIRHQILELSLLTTKDQKLLTLQKLTSRLYEAAQVESTCRKMAEFHHAEWRTLKASI